MRELNVLSLFDGMSCGRLALERSDISVGNYYASEVDKFATLVSEVNYPDIIRLGDVTKWEDWDLDWSTIDLLIGGFPCQSFSLSGLNKGFDDERGQLAYVTRDIFKHVQSKNPNVKFLFENVKMSKVNKNVLDDLFGVEGELLNSRLFSAQNRPRIYWTNIKGVDWNPEDKGILLKDIVEDKTVYWGAAKRGRYTDNGTIEQRIEVNGTQKSNAITTVSKDYLILSDKAIGYMDRLRNGKPRWEFHRNPLDGKAACLTANMFKGVPYGVIEEYCRRLSPLECERLQTVPDNFTESVSNTQRYKMLGNGWNIDTICHILKNITYEN
jgi:DNA-cytosine methyltransferase